MKKERIIYLALTASILALFSFEMAQKKHRNDIDIISISPDKIQSISIEIPSNVFFIAGKTNNVMLEGNSKILGALQLEEINGKLSLKVDHNSTLYEKLQTLLWHKETFNLYITSSLIEEIEIIDINGNRLHNAIFNEDRGILEVRTRSLTQLINSLKREEKCEESMMCATNLSNNLVTCL